MSTSTAKVRISLACIACKKRKAKCSGGPPPCQSCKVSDTLCIIDESLDGRRKASAKRTYDELTYHKTFIEGLLSHIRRFDGQAIDQLVRMIKADASLGEIGALIDQNRGSAGQGASAEDSLQGSQMEQSASRNMRRKIEARPHDFSSTASTSSDTDQKHAFEYQAMQLSDQETVISFLKHTTYDELGEIAQYLKKSNTTGVYSGLLQYVSQLERHAPAPSNLGRPALVSRRSASTVDTTSDNFSKARTLSLPNLFEYQHYVQGLFSEYSSSTLKTGPITDSRERNNWHPALKTRFSSSSSGASSSPYEEADLEDHPMPNAARPTLSSSASRTGRKGKEKYEPTVASPQRPSASQIRLTFRNDPKGEHFAISPSVSQGAVEEFSLPQQPTFKNLQANDIALEQRMRNLNLPLYQLLPLTGMDDSLLARSYTSYRDEARTMLLNGVPSIHLFGTPDTEVNLLFRPRTSSDPHSVCNWASELCGAFRRDMEMPWIMASVMLLSRFMRWLLLPTEESYDAVPAMMRPTQSQRFIPHNPAADIIVIPALRDALCMRFRDCITPLINNCHFNWPYALVDAVKHDPGSDTYILTDKFVEHVLIAENFTLSRRILESFPEIAGRTDVTFVD